MTVRTVTYNVSGCLDTGAAGEVLAGLAPQVVCLLEAPSMQRLRRLARFAGLEVAARAGRKGSGTAVLVDPSVSVRASSPVPLTTPRDVPTREATHTIVSTRGLRLSVTAVQFGLRPEVRRTNHDELLAFLDSVDVPTLVGADLNESVRSPVATSFAERYQDAFALAGSGPGETYPTVDPSTRQDFVFVDRQLGIERAFTATEPPVDVASHHRPVVADLASPDVASSEVP